MKKQFFSLALFAVAWLVGNPAQALDQDGDYYLIGSKADLQAWKEISGYEATNAKLTDDIDGVDFMLCDGTPSFTGTFDGQGHTITLNLEVTKKYGALFFNFAGTLKNVIIGGKIVAKNENCSPVAGYSWSANSRMENVISIATIEVDFTKNVSNGGLLGCTKYNITFMNCVSAVKVTGNQGYNHGFVGWMTNGVATIKNSISIMDIDASAAATGSCSWGNPATSSRISVSNSYSVKTSADNDTPTWSNVYATVEQMASGYVAYNINTAAGSNVLFQTLGSDNYPVPFSTHGTVYASGHKHCDLTDYEGVTYNNTSDETNIDDHDYNSNFLCNYCGAYYTDYKTPDGEGYYELGTVDDVKWFAGMVNQNGSMTAKAKLIDDIDFTGVTYTPIGHSTGQKYMGEFDGQNHKIMNLTTFSQDNPVGFFGYLRADGSEAAHIHNLIIDSSCSFSGKDKVGAITGAVQSGVSNNASKPIIIESCVNNAPVTSTAGTASGFVGAATSNYPKLIIRNCINTGNIIATGNRGTAFCSWFNNADGTFENCLNIGSVSGNGDSYNLAVFGSDGGTRRITNCYDLCSSPGTVAITQGNQGTLTTAAPLASGEVCARLGYAFHQNIGSDAMPTLDKSKGYVTEIKAAGWSTQYITDSDVAIPSGIEAFAGVVNTSAGTITLAPISGKIKANEPVVLRGAAGLYNFMPTTGASDVTNNLLGSDGTVSGGSSIYALAKKGEVGSEVVGFYPVGSGVTIPAGKAYLEYTPSGNGGNEVKGFTFVFDEDDATGISLMEDGRSQMEDGAIYNIAGQRLDNSQFTIHNSQLKRGIYIVNGKKVLK